MGHIELIHNYYIDAHYLQRQLSRMFPKGGARINCMRLEYYEIKLPRRLTAMERDKLITRCQQHYLTQMEGKES
jgi:hypothetical protein